MNKFVIAASLLVGLVGLVAANKLGHHHHHHHSHHLDQEGLEDDTAYVSHRRPHLKGGHRCGPCHGGVSGSGSGSGAGFGSGPGSNSGWGSGSGSIQGGSEFGGRHHGIRHGGIHGGSEFGGEGGFGSHHESSSSHSGIFRPHNRHSGSSLGREIGKFGGAGIGAVGAIRGENRRFKGQNLRNRFNENDNLDVNSGAFVGGSKHLDVDRERRERENDEGIHKHQVHNNDITLVRDKSSGVNDIDGFRRGSEQDENDRFSTGASFGAGKSANLHGSRNVGLESEQSTISGSESSLGAGGAIGAGIGGGSF